MKNVKRQMELNNYFVVGSNIYSNTTQTNISSNIQFSMCNTSMGSNIQIIYKER
jgi:hypothetical protein